MNRIFDLFVRRSRMSGAIAIVALVAGVLSALSLPIAFFPSVARPAISVTCSYPGANSREVMNTVAGPLEDKVNGVEGFDNMSSSCSDTGAYSLTVYFQAGYDRDLALMKVQAAVQQALTQLPQEVKNTGVTVGIGQTIDLGYVTCYSERGEMTRDEVVDYVFGVVNPAISRVQGIGAASVQDEKIAMRVWLDSDRMAALGINTSEVVDAIKAQNVQASLGTVGASPTDDVRCRVISLVSKGRLTTAEEFGAIIVRTKQDGSLVYLRDIAKLGLGHESYAHMGLFGDKAACVTHLYQLPGANTLETIARVKKLLAELEQRFPGDLRWDMTVDVSRYSSSALGGAAMSLALAALIALVALIALFRSLRMALVPLCASTVVFAIVLTVLAATGFFITVLTLYALAAALVFMFGVTAYVTAAHRRGQLAETRIPVLAASALVSFAALVLLLIGGVQGLILRQFAVVFAVTGLATGFVALTVVPALAGLKVNRRIVESSNDSAAIATGETPVAPESNRTIDESKNPKSHTAFVVACAVVAALALATLAISARMPRDLVPNEDFGVVLVDIKTNYGTSRPKVVEIATEIYQRACKVCDIEKSCTVFGEGIFSPSGENAAKMYLVLKPWSERGAGESTREIIARLRKSVADIPEAEINFLTLPTVPGIGTAAYVSPLVLSTADNDPVRLASEAHRLQAILARSPLADGVTCGYNTDSPHLRIKVDRAKCELLHVPLSSLFATLQHYLGSIYINDINLGTQVNRVTLMSDWKGRSTPETMAGLHVRSTTGAMVPVSTLLEYDEEPGPNTIYRHNRYIYCTVDVSQKQGVSLQDMMDEISRIFARELPRDFDTGWSGIAYEESSNPGHMDLMIVLSVLAVYLVLLVRFESWRKAFFALLPTVAGVFGGVLLLFVTGVSLSIYSRFALLVIVFVTASFSLFDDSVPGATGILPVANPIPGAMGVSPVAEPKSSHLTFWLLLIGAAMALPLVLSSGAGEVGSRSFGMTLLGGYIFFACVGLPLMRGLRMSRQSIRR